MRAAIYTTVFFLLAALNAEGQNSEVIHVAENKPVYASSETEQYPALMAVDGKVTRDSKWMTDPDALPPHFLEIDLQRYVHVDSVVVHTGIPEDERTPAEEGKAAGFWAVKHFRLQYWDDANWTDIPSSEITENRQTAAHLHFSPAILTFKLRFVALDGEPLNVMEIEIFGEEAKDMAPPVQSATPVPPGDASRSTPSRVEEVEISVKLDVVGKTMKYVAYNQAYYLPGSNTSGWLEYAGVNSLRVWTSLSTYVPVSCVQVDSLVTGLPDFEARKAQLRKDPENNAFIRWEALQDIYSTVDRSGTNAMVFDFVLEEAKRLDIEVLLQINERRFADDWYHKWQQWQRFYALAYYAARKGDVSMFAMQNEPNHRHSGPMPIEEWLRGMQLVSDAVRCAVEDVNARYGKQLVPRFVGPVTAGTNTDWWAKVIQCIRTDYRGNTVDDDLIDIFSTHSYNSPAAGYETRVKSIRELIRENHPAGKELPVVFTEIGRWMNAYLIDQEETMDSPSLFTEWAGIYTQNMLNGGYGMWAFKFANNTSSTYPSGIKSGHHFTWKGRRLVEDTWENRALGKPVTTSSGLTSADAAYLTDGNIEDRSTFVFSPEEEKWMEIDLLNEEKIGSALVYTGSSYGVFTGPDRVKHFKLQYKDGKTWRDIPGASVVDWKYVQVLLEFDEPVQSRYFRMVVLDEDTAKVREIKLFRHGEGPETAQESFDISGIQRTGEVVRLFAKGFKEQRDLLRTIVADEHPGLDVCTSFDEKTGNYYIWLVQRSRFAYQLKLDFSALGLPAGTPVIAEAVGPRHYGEVVDVAGIQHSGIFEQTLPGQTVMLLTIPSTSGVEKTALPPTSAVTVSGNRRSVNEGDEYLKVSLDASKMENNNVSYVHFENAALSEPVNEGLSLLGIDGFVDKGEETMQIHVYGFPSGKLNTERMTWGNAPHLDAKEALVRDVGQEVFFVGQISFDKDQRYHYLDVTKHLEKCPNGVTFILVRETRHMGDYGDKGRQVLLSPAHSDKSPVLIQYHHPH